MIKEIKHIGHVDEKGALQINRLKFAEDLRNFDGKEVEVIVRRRVKTRSDNQNGYLWSVVYPCVWAGLVGVGYDLEKGDLETVHEWCKKEFLPTRKMKKREVKNSWGEFITLPLSTKQLSTVEFNEYLERIAQFSAEMLGTVIPEPTGGKGKDGYFPTEERFTF